MILTRTLILTLTATLLQGCYEGRKNTEQLCADNPSLQCERLNIGDGQCRVPRTDLIWHRHEVLNNPTDVNQVKNYRLTYEYKRCLELASQIQPLEQTGVKEKRFNALVNSTEDLDTIVTQLEKSNSPEALYFLWSQTGSDDAKRSFLRLEGSVKLETAEMQYALATFYTGRDNQKTSELLLHSLELSKGKTLNNEVIQSLASTTHRMGKKEQAYIWAIVAKHFEVPIASEMELQLLYGFDEEKFKQLREVADNIGEAIEDGTFAPSMINKYN